MILTYTHTRAIQMMNNVFLLIWFYHGNWMEECENQAENAKPIFLWVFCCCCFGSLCLSALFNGTLELSIFFPLLLFVVVDFFGHSLYAYDRAMRRDMCVCGWCADGMGLFRQWLTERNLFDTWRKKQQQQSEQHTCLLVCGVVNFCVLRLFSHPHPLRLILLLFHISDRIVVICIRAFILYRLLLCRKAIVLHITYTRIFILLSCWVPFFRFFSSIIVQLRYCPLHTFFWRICESFSIRQTLYNSLSSSSLRWHCRPKNTNQAPE